MFAQTAKDNKPFPQSKHPPTPHPHPLIFLSVFIFLSPSFYLHLALDSPCSPLSWLFLLSSFLSHHRLWSLPCSFLHFLLMEHSLHSCWLLRGKDPAGRPRPNIITVLSACSSHPISLLTDSASPFHSLPFVPSKSLYWYFNPFVSFLHSAPSFLHFKLPSLLIPFHRLGLYACHKTAYWDHCDS